jgi:hypothetical protein
MFYFKFLLNYTIYPSYGCIGCSFDYSILVWI